MPRAALSPVKKSARPVDKHVGKRVRMRRLMLNMSQTEVGRALGVTFQQVQKYEKGTNRVSASRLQHLSEILSVPIPFFFEGAPGTDGDKRADTAGMSFVHDFVATSDGLALVKAFIRLKDRRLKRSIVELVEQIAERPAAERDQARSTK